MKGTKKDPSLELALAAADLADDGKALGITILDLREVSSVADYFVIASGRSHIQVEAVCDRIEEGVRERLDRRPIAVEGLEQSLWAVIDYGSVVVHVFQESVREIYDLERLWSLAPRWKHEDGPPESATPTRRASAAKAPKSASTARSGVKSANTTARKAASATTRTPVRKPARRSGGDEG